MQYTSVDPSTGRQTREWPSHDLPQALTALADAAAAQAAWRHSPHADRAALLFRLADVLDARTEALAECMADEMGKPLAEGRAEAGKCALVCRFYAERGPAMLAPQPVQSDAQRSWVAADPLGVVLAIMPWNFPLWQVFRFAAPALMAGNGLLLKHAPQVQGCAEATVRVWREAGLPEGLAANLRLSDGDVATLIGDRRIAAVTLTGSTRAGRQVAAVAGAALKKTVLELGGSDPFIVLDDADLDRAADVGVASRLLNCGQSCIAAKRFIVQRSVLDPFTDRVQARLRDTRVGPPRDPRTQMGPMARADLRAALQQQVDHSVENGAVVLCGGQPLPGEGWFYPPTLLTNVGPGQQAWEDELFGPVATIHAVDSVDEAIAAANDTPHGLGASLWTRRTHGLEALIGRIDAGAVFVNGMVKSDPRLPFGGIKASGWGRELGTLGLMEFVNRRTVWVGP
jgi:succinate-semialdehyde dehydrogenase/glutarate-semialdehyde dehydrogenase